MEKVNLKNQYEIYHELQLVVVKAFSRNGEIDVFCDLEYFQEKVVHLEKIRYGKWSGRYVVIAVCQDGKEKQLHRLLMEASDLEEVIFFNDDVTDLRAINFRKLSKGKAVGFENEKKQIARGVKSIQELFEGLKKKEDRDAPTSLPLSPNLDFSQSMIGDHYVVYLDNKRFDLNLSEVDAKQLAYIFSLLK
ncbi:hypothetical protein OCA96_12120 [Bacillus cereus]|nr:hypothetical protein [Bacillus cereus]